MKAKSGFKAVSESILYGFFKLWETFEEGEAYVFKGFSADSGIKTFRFDILFNKETNNKKDNLGCRIKGLTKKLIFQHIKATKSILNQYVNDFVEIVVFSSLLYKSEQYVLVNCKENVRNAMY